MTFIYPFKSISYHPILCQSRLVVSNKMDTSKEHWDYEQENKIRDNVSEHKKISQERKYSKSYRLFLGELGSRSNKHKGDQKCNM